MRSLAPILAAALCAAWSSGARAQNCFFSADFEDGGMPTGWTSSIVTIVATGEPTEAWTVGTSSQANANTFFPVPDIPIGNRFAMANDDAPPCDCAMDPVHLTTPVIDLSARTNVALECRIFHEMTLGGGDAVIEATTNGTDWAPLDTLDAVMAQWQRVFLDLSAYDGEAAFQLRFTWSDGGSWASGLAVDDVCLHERPSVNASVTNVRFGDSLLPPFNTTSQDLRYSMLPLEQAGPVIVSVEVANRGTTPLPDMTANADLLFDGAPQASFSLPVPGGLAPGMRTTAVITTGWVPVATGQLQVQVHVEVDGGDGDVSDNSGSDHMRITGPGWDDGYGAMACDEGTVQGRVGSSLGFIAVNRMEIIREGSWAHGISAVIGVDSQAGEEIRAILMDGNFTFIDTSLRYTITQDDIDAAYGGAVIFLPLVTAPLLAPGDHFAGMQRLQGSGHVSIATSGTGAPGRSALMVGSTFDIDWLTATPMVRLHLNDYGVGLNEPVTALGGVVVFPNPMDRTGHIQLDLPRPTPVRYRVLDIAGRELITNGPMVRPAGISHWELDAGQLPAGTYLLQVVLPTGASTQRISVVH